MTRALSIAFALFCTPIWAAARPEAEMKPFISRLIARMTVPEKIGQLTQYTADMSQTGASVRDSYKQDISEGRVGSIFNAYTPEFTRELQKMAVEKTRMKIPLLFGYDVVHGHRTIFPIPLGEAASWDLHRIETSARLAAEEAAADGIHWTFAPMVDITRDPRWGRVSEGAGEDTWLGSKIAAARVRGFQGAGGTDSVLACVKHFAAYGAPQAGREYGVVDISERTLEETYLPPFRAAIDAGVATVMTSFNEINGTPSTANRWLLTDLLRGRWKFKGLVVTDYTSINELVPHGVAANESEAGALALNAGVDIDMQGAVYANYLQSLLKDKKVSLKQIDAAVRRVLEAKYKLGLFGDPYRFSDAERAKKTLMSPEHLEHALDIAHRSIVLLKNDKNVLPLVKNGTLAVIGPFAEDKRDLIGNWSAAGDWKKAETLLDAIKTQAGKMTVLTARGANLLEDQKLIEFLNKNGGEINNDKRSPGDMIDEAVKLAKKADVVVLALGETQGMSGEAASRTNLELPANQQALLKAVRATGKPLVIVLFNGRPLVLEFENANSDAIVEAWFLGHRSGTAIADALFGLYNPSGKLPMTFPRNVGQIPIFYNSKNTGRPFDAKSKYTSKYLDVPNEPLFPFGWGLSYSKFTYSEPELSRSTIAPGESLKVSVGVSNAGDTAGEETVQLYIRDVTTSVTRPLKELRGFQKVFLKPGQTEKVMFELTPEDLKMYDLKMKWVLEPGEFRVMTGGNSAELKSATFAVKSR